MLLELLDVVVLADEVFCYSVQGGKYAAAYVLLFVSVLPVVLGNMFIDVAKGAFQLEPCTVFLW